MNTKTVFTASRSWLMAAAAMFATAAGLQASTVSFLPQPARTGQAITATFTSISFGCEDEGQMVVESISGGTVVLRVTPAGCPILPCCWTEYTAQASFGPLAAGTYRVEVYEENTLREVKQLTVLPAPTCTSTSTALCLGDAHFEVTAHWRDFAGNTGVAHTVPDQLEGAGDYGLLWFFTADNPELLVKVLDGCGINGRYWVFISPGSNVEYAVTVRDVRSGQTRTYSNPLHSFPSLFADTNSFPCAAP